MKDMRYLKNTKQRVDSLLADARVLQRKYGDDFDPSQVFDAMQEMDLADPEEAFLKAKGMKYEKREDGGVASTIKNETDLRELSIRVMFGDDKPEESIDEAIEAKKTTLSSKIKPKDTNPAGQKLYPNED